MKRRVLVIDDELSSLEILHDLLSPEFEVQTCSSSIDGLQFAKSQLPDLIILDLNMPNLDGLSVCKIVREAEVTRHIPILVLTGTLEADPRVQAFLLGADDLVAKPFSSAELLARVRSKIRRVNERDRPRLVLACGNLRMDLEKLDIKIDDELIHLSVLEFDLLKFFVENKYCVISREKVLKEVWCDSIVSDRTVDTHMASLRKKLTGFDHRFATVYSAGYILKSSDSNKSLTAVS